MKFGKKKSENCLHKFEDRNAVVIKDQIRMISVCSKCGVSVHRKVYTISQLREVENNEREDN